MLRRREQYERRHVLSGSSAVIAIIVLACYVGLAICHGIEVWQLAQHHQGNRSAAESAKEVGSTGRSEEANPRDATQDGHL